MPVDPNHHVPIYQQIVEHLCAAVAAGVYKPGEPLPSVRSLAVELVVNPNTVQRACQELERMGLVRMRKGLGMFVTENGRHAAQTRAEAAVQSRFTQGIGVGRSAGMPTGDIRRVFDRTLNDSPRYAAPEPPDHAPPPTPGAAADDFSMEHD